MSVKQPVLTQPHGGETITMGGGSSIELKVESSQSGGDYGVVLWTVRAGEEPPLHTHSREDELVYVVQGQLVARVGDTRVEVGPGAYAALPRGAPHTIEVVGDQATLLVSFVPGGLERFLVPRDGERPDPAAFGLSLPSGCGPRRAAFVTAPAVIAHWVEMRPEVDTFGSGATRVPHVRRSAA
jgi:quercetin dioxygenase-like cupin family protein